jgi:RHS repeat-associated protein
LRTLRLSPNTYTYDSFGKLTASTGTLTNPIQYTGREFDQETTIYFYRSRYYDASVGRFISEDSVGFGGGSNFYRYVLNNPVNLVDPQGHAPSCVMTSSGLFCTGANPVSDQIDVLLAIFTWFQERWQQFERTAALR